MENEIQMAINLLRSNGFVVKKLTQDMIEDSKECEEMAERGEDKDCSGCSCGICVGQ